MLERMYKLAFTMGLVLGTIAIILMFTGGSYSHETDNSGFSMSIRLGSESDSLPVILGFISVTLLVIGGVLLVVSKQAQNNEKTRALGEYLQKLHRSQSDCKLAGVCGGLADGTAMPSWAWRMLFLVLTFVYGVGLLPYIIMWICLPAKQVQAN